jgi:hypothetical protein
MRKTAPRGVDALEARDRSVLHFGERRSLSRQRPCHAKSKVDRKPIHLRGARVLDESSVSGSPQHPSTLSKQIERG